MQRCLGTAIFPPKRAGGRWTWGKQAGVGGGQPRCPFRVSLPVAESSGKWRGPRGRKMKQSLAWITVPRLRPQILAPGKPPTGWRGIRAERARRVSEAGRRGLQAGQGRPRPSGVAHHHRCPALPAPHHPGQLPRWAAAWNPNLGPLGAPRAQRFDRCSFLLLLFCPIGYHSVLHPVWFSNERTPRGLFRIFVCLHWP